MTEKQKAMTPEQPKKTFHIKRYILEEFFVEASNREEAKAIAVDPAKITVTKETIKILK